MAIEEQAPFAEARRCRGINIVAVQLFLSAFVTARFHGIRRGEIKNRRRESNAAIAINQGARGVPLVNSRKAREIARGIIPSRWVAEGEPRVQRATRLSACSGVSILCDVPRDARREGSRRSPAGEMKRRIRANEVVYVAYAIARGDYLAPPVRIIYT